VDQVPDFFLRRIIASKRRKAGKRYFDKFIAVKFSKYTKTGRCSSILRGDYPRLAAILKKK